MAKKRRLITRRKLKWAGLLATVILVGLYISSIWAGVRVSHFSEETMMWARVANGGLEAGLYHAGELRSFADLGVRVSIEQNTFADSVWWFSATRSGLVPNYPHRRIMTLVIPLWIPLLLIAGPTAWLWRTDRRAKPWQCANCRYDLRGLEGGENGVCPECGSATGDCP